MLSPRGSVGRFLLDRRLGGGRGVETWLARESDTNQALVLKWASASPSLWLRLTHEGAILAQDLPGVPRLREVGRWTDSIYVASDFVPGATLAELLANGPLPLDQTLQIATSLFETLSEVHRRGLLHRDLKPANLIWHEGRLTVIDWGLSRSQMLHVSLRDLPVGSLLYMAPEMAGLIPGAVGDAADLYSAGAVLFECLAGRPPYPARSVNEVLRGHLSAPIPQIRAARPDVPRPVGAILEQLLEKNPDARSASAAAVLADLEAFRRGKTIRARHQGPRPKLTQPMFVGREAELERLAGELSRVRRERVGSMLIVEAPSGGGKTRLLDAFAVEASARGARVWRGQGLSHAGVLPLQLLSGVFCEMGGDSDLLRRLQEHLGGLESTFLSLAPELRPLLPGHREDVTSEKMGSTAAILALQSWLEALGSPEQPAVLLLDDAQWSDGLSLEFFSFLDRSQEIPIHLLVVIALRGEESPAGMERWQTPRLRLAPLDPDRVEKLAQSMAGPLPSQVTAWIADVSGGNPFLAVEAVRSLGDHGGLVVLPSDCTTSDRAGALLRRRIQSVGSRVEALLGTAAVLGRTFDDSMLARVVALPEAELRLQLSLARSQCLIWRDGSGMRHTFSHDRVLETALSCLSPKEIVDIHSRVADLLLEERSGDSFALAYHLCSAGRAIEAIPYCLRAAREARRRYDFSSAEVNYRRALIGGPENPETAEGLGDMLRLQGRYEEALLSYNQALELQPEPLICARLEYHRGDIYHGMRRLKDSSRCFRASAAYLERCPQTSERDDLRLRSLGGLSQDAQHRGEHLKAVLEMLKALLALGSDRSGGGRAVLLASFTTALAFFAPVHPLARRIARRSLLRLEGLSEWDRGRVMARALATLAQMVPIGEVLPLQKEALRLLLPTGELWEYALARHFEGLYRSAAGDFREMAAEGRKLYRELRALGHASRAMALHLWAQAGGEVPDEVMTDELSVTFEDDMSRGCLALAGAWWHYRHGRYRDAARLLEGRLSFMEHTSPLRAAWAATCWRRAADQATDWRRTQDLKAARKAARKAVQLARGGIHLGLPHALREAGLAAAAQGHVYRSRALLRESLERAERLGHRYQAAWTRLEWARLRVAGGDPKAGQQADEALAELALMNAPDWHRDQPAEAPIGPVPIGPLDRFFQLLEWGRTLATTLEEPRLLQRLQEAAVALLRPEDCMVLSWPEMAVLAGPPRSVSRTLVARAIREGFSREEDVCSQDSVLLSDIRSAMAAPVLVEQQPVACLYVGHRHLKGLFGDDEARAMEFLTSLAGAALENARRLAQQAVLEAELGEREGHFRSLFEQAGVGLVVLDSDGIILEANRALHRLVEKECLAGTPFRDLLLSSAGLPASGHAEVRFLRGSQVAWGQLSRTLFEHGSVLTLNDITHRRLDELTRFLDEERRLLATELHDGISQPVAALAYQLRAAGYGEDLVKLASRAAREVSRQIYSLRNPVREGRPLEESLQDLVEWFGAEAGLSVRLDLPERLQLAPLPAALAFRLVEEALENVRLHARAGSARVWGLREEGRLELAVEDDGAGFSPDALAHRPGFDRMLRQLEILGGSLRVTSASGQGTRVEFSLP